MSAYLFWPGGGRRIHLRLKGVLAMALLFTWLAVALGIVAALGLENTHVAGKEEVLRWRSFTAAHPGWTLRHRLSTDPVVNTRLLEHLAARGLAPGLNEEISLPAGATGAPALRGLLARGWSLAATEAFGTGADPEAARLEIFSPLGERVWVGTYPGADLRMAGVPIWDTRAFEMIAAGNRLPAVVPTGCGPPEGQSREAFSWLTPLAGPLRARSPSATSSL